MRHVRHALPLALAATALFAAGCGDDDGDKKGQTSSPAASTSQPAKSNPGAALRRSRETTGFLIRRRAVTAPLAFRTKATGAGPSTYCSPTGDYCVGVNKRGGTVLLAIASLAFQGNYRLCVAGPPGRGCKTFRLVKRGQMYASTIAFTAPARGRYTASWFLGSTKLGRSLSFTA